MFSFAWIDATETEFTDAHHRVDEAIFSLSVSQAEGDFATCDIEWTNPRVGLLAPGRKQWAWIGYRPDNESADGFLPLFRGRINGLPTDLDEEVIKTTFTARPVNVDAQKLALAATLQVAPYYDPIWFSPDAIGDPDNVLESRSALWHIDRCTHVVTISDFIIGEEGTIEVDEGIAFYDNVSVSYGQPPCRQVNVTASVSWDQIGQGTVLDVTGNKIIESFTGAGFVDNWPKGGENIGGGWSVATASATRVIDSVPDKWSYDPLNIRVLGRQFNEGDGKAVYCPSEAKGWFLLGHVFPSQIFVVANWKILPQLSIAYDVSRGKSENIQFTLTSDTQSIVTDDTDGAAVDMSFSTSEVTSPIDPGGVMPLGAYTARAFLPTARGTQAIEYLLMIARAKLVTSARCVDVSFDVPFDFGFAQGVNLRKSAVLTDSRLPGGIAGGKIKSYVFSVSGDTGVENCSVTVGCSIGHGGAIEAVTGEPDYVNADYVDSDYQRYTGEYVLPSSGDLSYTTLEGADVIDDGIRFEGFFPYQDSGWPTFAMQSDEQEDSIQPHDTPEDIYTQLNLTPTTFHMQLKPLNTGPFAMAWVIETSPLQIAKTIDLEAGVGG